MGGWSVMVMILCVYKWSQILVSVCVQVRLNVYKWSLCTSDPFLCVQVIPLPFQSLAGGCCGTLRGLWGVHTQTMATIWRFGVFPYCTQYKKPPGDKLFSFIKGFTFRSVSVWHRDFFFACVSMLLYISKFIANSKHEKDERICLAESLQVLTSNMYIIYICILTRRFLLAHWRRYICALLGMKYSIPVTSRCLEWLFQKKH